jgi:histidinol-phosphate aminotransferase|tara:strand:+ start:14295 stop:15395 length:1101 start_codon:yes stop_codon:yes gene_type:complete
MIKAKSYIENIKPYIAGKSKIGNKNVIKLSSNENSLGSSNKAIEAYKSTSDQLFRYPDGPSSELREAIAKKYNIKKERITCGAGSDEIISLLIEAFAGDGDAIIQSEYGFLMYQISATKFGAKTIKAKETNLKTDINEIIKLISSKTKIIFIANPNNPTGSYINKVELDKLIQNTPKNIIIAMDLAYAEYIDESDYPNIIEYVKNYENVIMMRTFSKIHGLAALRLGWCYSSQYIADSLNKVRGPFNVSMAAQKAGIAAINDIEFVKKSKDYNKEQLEFVKNELLRLNIKFYTSFANFILIDFKNENNCQKINQYLLNNGIIIRDMKAYNLPHCLRMTIGMMEENKEFIRLIESFFQKTDPIIKTV